MSKHTPGPWLIGTRDTKATGSLQLPILKDILGDGKSSFCVAWVANHNGASYCRSDEANARLIAAAPEMLELLKNVVLILDEEGGRIDCLAGSLRSKDLEAIIAKAEGRS